MQFKVLGPLEVVGEFGPVSVKGARRRALLGVLLFHAGRTVPMARLIDGIWPVDPPASAVYNLRTYVHGLRRILSAAGDSTERLASAAAGYRLHVDQAEFDLLRFEHLTDDGRRAMRNDEPAAAAERLGRAVGLWRGTPLEDIPGLGPDVTATATALQERHWEAVSTLVDARLQLGQESELLPQLWHLAAERPLDERTQAQLVTALARAGRTADALEAYQRARGVLVEELGVEPGRTLQAAQQAVLTGPGSPVVIETARAHRPHGLPMKPPTFLGRGAVLSQIRTIAAAVTSAPEGDGHATVITVSGAPGVGKSTVAVAAGYHLTDLFVDGQLFASLAGTTGHPRAPGDLLAELLAQLGVEPAAIPAGLSERAALFRCLVAGRRLLLVLDDAADGRQLRPLLPGAGHCLVLVTSRSRLLELEVGWRLNLGPLDHTDAVALLASTAGEQRVRDSPEASDRIAAACEELPLAIRIVGARLAGHPGLALPHLAERLEDEDRRLGELTVGDVSVRDRLLESYEALDPASRAALRVLGRTADLPLTDASAPGVLGIPSSEADQVVEHLVQHNLLTPVAGAGPGLGYVMSDLLRLFTLERGAADG
jgi:DNA-binding SARP family transcriptional activator